MRVWDVGPGYLSQELLLNEQQDVHRLWLDLRNGNTEVDSHPERDRWISCLGALERRHELLVAELTLRGLEAEPLSSLSTEEPEWPATFVDTSGQQLAALKELYRDSEPGRIPIPKNSHQYWAQHKYSVMARSPKVYKEIGVRVSQTRKGPPADWLCERLVELLRERAPWPRTRNALAHMWGYVSKYASSKEEIAQIEHWLKANPRSALKRIASMAVEHQVEYLVHSTALTELMVYLPEGDAL